MEALIGISSLGLLIMLVELLGLRKLVGPVAILGLLAVLYLNFLHYTEPALTFYNDMYVVNRTTTVFNAVILVIAIFIIFLAKDFYQEEKKYWSDYLSIYIFAVCGAVLMIGAHHLLMTFIGIEILSVSLYVLAGSNRKKVESNEAGMKYFLMGSFASGILLFGMVLMYGATGTLHYEKLNQFLLTNNAFNLGFIYTGLILILVGFFFKISAAPFHFWSPDVYQGSPSIVTAFMATIGKIAAVATLYLVLSQVFSSLHHLYDLILIIICIATICIGNILAIVQTNLKRMLAYSGISHAGFMLLGILVLDYNQWYIIAYYTMGYGIANLVAFGVSILIFKTMKNENISAFNGLVFKNPVFAICLTLALLSMASIPPLAGFWGKYFILTNALEKGFLIIVLVAIVNTVLSIYFYFKVIVAMYVRVPNSTPIKTNVLYTIIILFFTLIMVVIGLMPNLIFSNI